MTTRKKAEWLVFIFFAVLILLVFQQIMTDMTDSGIASGGPYDNAAAYPRAIAVIIGVFMAVLLLLRSVLPENKGAGAAEKGHPGRISFQEIKRPVLLFVIFAAYLWFLGFLGYYLSTPVMILAVMFLSGVKKPVEVIIASLVITFVLAFLFEFFLKIVLPGGIFRLNMPW